MSATSSCPILYSFRRCPYARRARLTLKASGTAVVLREIVLRHKPPEMLAISPKGTVPVLLLPDGQVIEQSLDIMRWALAQSDPQGWLNAQTGDEVQALIDLNDGPFKQLLDRYKYPERHPQQTAAAWRDEAVALVLQPLEHRLQDHPWLLGPQRGLADVALMPFIRQFAQVDADWFAHAPLPALRQWLAQQLADPLFEAVMHKWPVWRPEDSPVYL
jgi:glutathione S-transferase